MDNQIPIVIKSAGDTESKPQETPQPQAKPRRLTLKQRRWLDLYMESGNATQSAIEAYGLDADTQYETARVIGSENITKLNIPFEELLEEVGLTDLYLTHKLKRNLNATKLYGLTHKVWADYPARNKALEIALKVKGKLIDKTDLTTQGEKLETTPTVIIRTNA